MRCLKCYKEIPGDAVFCPYCGINLNDERKKEEKLKTYDAHTYEELERLFDKPAN